MSFFLQSCGNKNLSRDKAKDLIVQEYSLPQPETTKLGKRYFKKKWGDRLAFGMEKLCWVKEEQYLVDVKSKLDNLQSKGLITINESDQNGDGCHYIWVNAILTNDGKKYLVSDSNSEYEVKTAEIAFGQITGIQISEQFKVATADYTLQRINFTPFADSSSNQDVTKHASNQDMTRHADFSLYDDGWRIKGRQ